MIECFKAFCQYFPNSIRCNFRTFFGILTRTCTIAQNRNSQMWFLTDTCTNSIFAIMIIFEMCHTCFTIRSSQKERVLFYFHSGRSFAGGLSLLLLFR